MNGSLELMKLFSTHPNVDITATTTNIEPLSPLHLALVHGHKDIIKYFVSLGVNPFQCDDVYHSSFLW